MITITRERRLEMAIELLAGTLAGAETDMARMKQFHPLHKRSANYQRALVSLGQRLNGASEEIQEALAFQAPTESPRTQHEIVSDGHTVWINGVDGMCLGRFSRFGADVHRTFAEQAANSGECLECTHTRPDREVWDRFVAAMLVHHGVSVPAEVIPAFLIKNPETSGLK